MAQTANELPNKTISFHAFLTYYAMYFYMSRFRMHDEEIVTLNIPFFAFI